VLEEEGQLDPSCKKLRNVKRSQKGGISYKPEKRRKANLIGDILHRIRLLKHFIEGNI